VRTCHPPTAQAALCQQRPSPLASWDPERARVATAELLRLAPDLILARSVSDVRAAQQADSAIALVSYCALRLRIMGPDASGKEIAGMRELMGDTPVIGFYSFGEGGVCEDGVSRYYNAAVSVLVIGKDLSPAARVALEAERLRVELEHKASELEERVAERTSELLASNAKLRRTQQFLDAVIENVPAMLFVKEATESRYVLINRAGEELLGLPRQELIGKNDYDFFPREEADFFVARDREVLNSGMAQVIEEESVHTRNKGVRLLTTKKIAIADDDGRPQYLLGVSEDITEQKRADERIAHMARHDPLTDLPNRTFFSHKLLAILQSAAAEDKGVAILCMDLDRFKEVNDNFGHATGDAVLCEAASRLYKVADGAFLARLGGDEFVLVAIDQNSAAAKRLANKLYAALSDDMEIDGHCIRVGLSIGITLFPVDGTDPTTLMRNADAALYQAKAEGRQSIRFFDQNMDKRLRERSAMQRDLKSAVSREEFILHYQPQARTDGEVVGFEALIRWRHPSRGMIQPDVFIPLAEENGLIHSIGAWVLREACREAASWPPRLQLAVNLSPVQFRHGDLVSTVHSILLETGLAPARFELEITEGVLVNDFSRASSIVRRLKALGVRIALDDFGKGYSSLSYLQSFHFDKIKIDPTFVMNLNRNTQSAAIIRAVIGLGRGLGLSVAAEGVETREQLDFLTQEGCDEVQGFFIGRPAPIAGYAAIVGRKIEELASVVSTS
jgi:diguanylate cyclase (GGDEF)-like protein/PAS domain S-box-containing protein